MISILCFLYFSEASGNSKFLCRDHFKGSISQYSYETLYLLSLSSLDNEPKATWGKNTEEFIVSKIMVNAIIKLYRKRGEGGEDHTETRDFDPKTFNYPPVLIAASVFPRSKMS